MDRFIECMCSVSVAPLYNLKSSMDRFIVLTDKNNNVDVIYLKSSMDRFIDMYKRATDDNIKI